MAFHTYSCNLTLFSLLSPHPFLIVLGDLRQPLVNGGGSNARERERRWVNTFLNASAWFIE